MKLAEQTSGLEGLSDADKDALILNLWEDLRQQRAETAALAKRLEQYEQRDGARAADEAPSRDLRAEIKAASKPRPVLADKDVRVRLGRGLGLLRSKLAIGGLAFAVAAVAFDYGLGRYQQGQLEQARLARLQLERVANAGLLVELRSIAYEPDGKSFRLRIETRNLDPRQPIYVMMSPVRVYEQSGMTWREVPARTAANQASGVVKLTDATVTYETVFEPNLKDWAELMPGYMHIRFENNRLISQRSQPEDDIVERRDRFYVYLKPHDADNAAIRARMKYAGEPPVFIPMPPH